MINDCLPNYIAARSGAAIQGGKRPASGKTPTMPLAIIILFCEDKLRFIFFPFIIAVLL